MAFSLNIDIVDRDLRHLHRLASAAQRPAVRKVMGGAVATALRKHFSRLDSERPNRLGGKRTHFYGQVRKSVQQPELEAGDGVKVAITHIGAAQRYFGGVITPRNRQWLAVPARAEAHGMRPREFYDLHFVLFRRDLAALVQNEQTKFSYGRKRKDGTRKLKTEAVGGGIFYWLVKRAHQQPDPSVLPPEHELLDAAIDAGAEYFQRLVERSGA